MAAVGGVGGPQQVAVGRVPAHEEREVVRGQRHAADVRVADRDDVGAVGDGQGVAGHVRRDRSLDIDAGRDEPDRPAGRPEP